MTVKKIVDWVLRVMASRCALCLVTCLVGSGSNSYMVTVCQMGRERL